MGEARFHIKRSRRARATADAVMEQVRDPATWSSWQSEIDAAAGPVPLAEGDVARGRASMLGFKVEGQSLAQEVGGSVFVEHVVVGVGMTVRYAVAPEGDEVVITHELTSDLPRGPLGSILSFFLKRRLRAMQRMLLERLARRAEERS